MLTFTPDFNRKIVTGLSRKMLMAIPLSVVFLATPADAQQPAQPGKAPAAKAAGDNKAGAGKKDASSAWVKLCEQHKDKDKGKVCLTHHERFHPTTGQPIISAAIRQIENDDEEVVMIMVPLGRLLQPGLAIAFDGGEPTKLIYSYCTALGCVAESKTTPIMIDKMKKAKELEIRTIDIARKKIGFKIPLSGFTRAYEGAPIDRKVYAKARKEMFDVIRARQKELIKRAKEAADKKKAAGGSPANPAEKKAP